MDEDSSDVEPEDEEEQDGSDVEPENEEEHDDMDTKSESNDCDLKPKAATGLLDANISNSEGTEEGDSKDEIINEETAVQEKLLEKTNKVLH